MRPLYCASCANRQMQPRTSSVQFVHFAAAADAAGIHGARRRCPAEHGLVHHVGPQVAIELKSSQSCNGSHSVIPSRTGQGNRSRHAPFHSIAGWRGVRGQRPHLLNAVVIRPVNQSKNRSYKQAQSTRVSTCNAPGPTRRSPTVLMSTRIGEPARNTTAENASRRSPGRRVVENNH